MKITTLRRYFFTLVNCWCLIFTGLPGLSYADPSNANGMMTREECPSGPESAYKWNSARNICELKSQTSALRDAYLECDRMESNEERNTCVENIRNGMTNFDSDEYNKNKVQGKDGLGWGAMGAYSAMTLYTIFQLIAGAGKSKDGGQCISRKIFMGASIASFAGDLYFKFFAKDKFEDLKKEYETVEGDTYEKQIKAFDYLEQEQVAVAESAKEHKTAYTIYTAAYGAATAMALIELSVGTATGTPAPCFIPADGVSDDAVKENNQANKEANQEMKAANKESGLKKGQEGPPTQRQSDAAAAQKKAAADLESAQGALLGAASKLGLDKLLGTSLGISILGGAGTILSGALAIRASIQQKEAEKNAELVRTTREKFTNAIAAAGVCRSRDDISEPRCYCYTNNGERNSERTRSETCQALWNAQDRNLHRDPTKEVRTAKNKPVGCYRIDGVWDPDCKCRDVKNDKGENGCYKAPFGMNDIAALGPGIGLPQVMDSLNKLYGGGLGSGEIAPAQISQNAARVGAARKKIEDKLKQDPQYQGKGLFNDAAFVKALEKKLTPKARELGRQMFESGLGAGSTGQAPAGLAAVMDKTRKDAGLPSVQLRGAAPAKSKSKKKVGFSLYGEEEKAAGTAHMDKNYDYSVAQKDIVERDDVSIWQVISNRYTQSGLRRLFDEGDSGL